MDLLEKTKIVIRSLVISSRKHLTTNQLNKDYEKSEGHNIPFRKLGYSTLRNFLNSIPDTVTPQHVYKLVCEQKPTRRNHNQPTIFRHRRIARNTNVDKITSDEPDEQKQSNIIDRIPALQENKIEQVKPTKTPTTEEVIIISKNQENDEEIPKIDSIPMLIDDNGTNIPNCSISNNKPGSSYPIFISEMNRPWRFYFHLIDRPDVEQMVDQLGSYCKHSTITMNESEMIVGNACVVFYVNKWFRAEFIRRPFNENVKVCLVDFGTIVTVNVSQCRYIQKYFCSIPKLCYVGALEFISPINNEYIEQKLVQNFCKMAKNKPLVGVVINVDLKNNVCRLVVIDTSKETEDIVLNKELLEVYKLSE